MSNVSLTSLHAHQEQIPSAGRARRWHVNLSALMTTYNTAKHFGRRTGILEPRLADRALGYLMSGRIVQKAAEYGSTRDWCDCPDSRYRRRICKHSIAVEIQRGHDEIMNSLRQMND